MCQLKLYISLCFVLFFPKLINTECRYTYATLCDNLIDLKNVPAEILSSVLIIGSENSTRRQIPIDFKMDIHRLLINRVTTIIVINQISELEPFKCDFCLNPVSGLHYMSFYKNTIRKIQKRQFPNLPIERLNLINNNIEQITPGAFTSHKIIEIDISHNFLDIIEAGALPSNNLTKMLTIKNNKLTYLEPGCFPRSLIVLNLASNQLTNIDDGVLADLVNLEKLVINKNKFRKIPKIEHMKNLVNFQIKENLLEKLDVQNFRSMKQLRYLDVSNNQLFDPNIIIAINTPLRKPGLVIKLAFNRLKDLNLKNLDTTMQSYILYGNPFDCSRIDEIRSTVKRNVLSCEAQFLSSGTVPVCVDFSSLYLTSDQEYYISLLMNATRTREEKFYCNLVPTS